MSLFRIRHEKVRSEGLTMTSYPVGNKTSLSRKPCIVDKTLQWITVGMHSRSFRICHEKSRELPPGGEIMMTYL